MNERETFSDSCRKDGDGQCDGFALDGDFCDCPHHKIWEPLESIEEYTEWHYDFWS